MSDFIIIAILLIIAALIIRSQVKQSGKGGCGGCSGGQSCGGGCCGCHKKDTHDTTKD